MAEGNIHIDMQGRDEFTPVMEALRDEDPFGPYEYVEAPDRCIGAEGECMWNRCTQRDSTCRCLCPVCVGDTPDVWGWDGDWPPS